MRCVQFLRQVEPHKWGPSKLQLCLLEPQMRLPAAGPSVRVLCDCLSRGRDSGSPEPPAQIPAGGITAPGCCRSWPELSASHQPADPLCTDPAMTTAPAFTTASTFPVSVRRCGGGQNPGPEDSDPGFGPFPAPNRPLPPRPINSHNSMSSNR
jgi:hypothetical protein